MQLAHLKRLWQPGRLLFWQMVFFNIMSSVCAWAMRTLPLNTVALGLVGFVALLNVVFGLLATWMLMREPPPASPGEDPTGRTRH